MLLMAVMVWVEAFVSVSLVICIFQSDPGRIRRTLPLIEPLESSVLNASQVERKR